jgi:hypothetical protein
MLFDAREMKKDGIDIHQAHKIPFLYTVFLSKELFLNQQLLLPSLFFHALL